MLRSATLSSLLLVAYVAGCRFGPYCRPSDGIHGIFFMFDGSTSAAHYWDDRLEFLQHFKTHVSPMMPIWFIQWSSVPEFCKKENGEASSWECYGKSDPCLNASQADQGGVCPKEQEEFLPSNWTTSEFDTAASRIFTKAQKGWTHPWGYLKNASKAWIAKKKEMRLPDDATALVVLLTDGQASDDENEKEATKLFKEAHLKFFGIHTVYNGDYSFEKYLPLMDDPENPHYIKTTKLNEELVTEIITRGCKNVRKQ